MSGSPPESETQRPATAEGVSSPKAAQARGANLPLAAVLDRHSVVGTLWRKENGRIRCLACAHRCLIAEGRRGICKVRFVQDGQLRVPFGYVAGGVASDPVEKKPFFHLYPGSDALTFGMLGCNFHCPYCQNWVTSQALREAASASAIVEVTPDQIVRAAKRAGARLVVSSYNEPLITVEWAVAVFKQAKAAGLACAVVSNGNVSAEALDFMAPWIVAYKIDLKTFNDQRYRTLGSTLTHVCEGIRMVHSRGLWVEIVTLVVPGFNDSESELRDIARFIASVSRDIPWHVTAFHPDYKMSDTPPTSPHQLLRAAEIGRQEGLRFVYAGNLPGRTGGLEDTYCPQCQETLIARWGFMVREYKLTVDGKCPKCQTLIPGIWSGTASVR